MSDSDADVEAIDAAFDQVRSLLREPPMRRTVVVESFHTAVLAEENDDGTLVGEPGPGALGELCRRLGLETTAGNALPPTILHV